MRTPERDVTRHKIIHSFLVSVISCWMIAFFVAPFSFAQDTLYWIENTGGTDGGGVIKYAPADGSGPVSTLYNSGVGIGWGIDLLLTGPEKILWTDQATGSRLKSAPLDGSGPVTTIELGSSLSAASGRTWYHIAIDPFGNLQGINDSVVYFGDADGISATTDPLVQKIIGTPIGTLSTASSQRTQIQALALDLTNNEIYYVAQISSAPGTFDIMKYTPPISGSFSGGTVTALLTGLQETRALALNVPLGKMYYSQFNNIYQTNLDGTGSVAIASGAQVGDVRDIVVDNESNLYVTASNLQQIYKLTFNGTSWNQNTIYDGADGIPTGIRGVALYSPASPPPEVAIPELPSGKFVYILALFSFFLLYQRYKLQKP